MGEGERAPAAKDGKRWRQVEGGSAVKEFHRLCRRNTVDTGSVDTGAIRGTPVAFAAVRAVLAMLRGLTSPPTASGRPILGG